MEAPPIYDYPGECCFDNKAIRRGFIRKVFAILVVQLSIVTGLVLACSLVDSIQQYITSDKNVTAVMIIFFVSLAIYIFTCIPLLCCKDVRRQHPINLILLFVFTTASAVMIAVPCAFYTVESVGLALAITVFCCGGIIIFAFNTKYDLSSCHGLVFCLLWSLLLCSLLIPIPYGGTWDKVGAGIGAIIFMFVLVYDVHRIMGKSDENALSAEEYVAGALMIYLDIINIFVRILRIVAKSR